MSKKLSGVLRDVLDRDAIASTASSYEHVYGGEAPDSLHLRKKDYKSLTNKYYDLVTDFFANMAGASRFTLRRAPLTRVFPRHSRVENFEPVRGGDGGKRPSG